MKFDTFTSHLFTQAELEDHDRSAKPPGQGQIASRRQDDFHSVGEDVAPGSQSRGSPTGSIDSSWKRASCGVSCRAAEDVQRGDRGTSLDSVHPSR